MLNTNIMLRIKMSVIWLRVNVYFKPEDQFGLAGY